MDNFSFSLLKLVFYSRILLQASFLVYRFSTPILQFFQQHPPGNTILQLTFISFPCIIGIGLVGE